MSSLLAATGNGKTLWYLTRGTGAVALILLTASVVLGVMSSTRLQTRRLPRFLVSGLHRNLTLLALVFLAVHVVSTVADGFAPIGFQDAFLPFISPYRPFWLGLGAVALDLLLALVVTSLLRNRIGLRIWRVLHWLAYAAWPVALVHALGTGSDARTGWLGVLAFVCTGAVLLSVLWRAGAARGRSVPLRAGAALAALALPLAILVWARSGPLASGWAARAGTPKSLIFSSRVARVRPAAARGGADAVTVPRAPTLPSGSFQADFRGKLHEAPAGEGLVTVAIDGRATGGFDGRVHVALRGAPLDGGGVQMIDSSVGMLPAGATTWSAGRVVALSGQQILADVQAPSSHSFRVLLALHIDRSSGSVTGVMRSGSHGFEKNQSGVPSE